MVLSFHSTICPRFSSAGSSVRENGLLLFIKNSLVPIVLTILSFSKVVFDALKSETG